MSTTPPHPNLNEPKVIYPSFGEFRSKHLGYKRMAFFSIPDSFIDIHSVFK